jgi:hypothetical protein
MADAQLAEHAKPTSRQWKHATLEAHEECVRKYLQTTDRPSKGRMWSFVKVKLDRAHRLTARAEYDKLRPDLKKPGPRSK